MQRNVATEMVPNRNGLTEKSHTQVMVF